ncbi:MAG: hypothetical protein WA738_21510 [Candidatus Angelobacter sp.]
MKNVETLTSTQPVFRVPIKGVPSLKGWAVRYLSGMEEMPDIKVGYWLTQFDVTQENVATFRFEAQPHLSFDSKDFAMAISDGLRESAEIQTEVVKNG